MESINTEESTGSVHLSHGLFHPFSSESVAPHNLPHVLLLLALQDLQKVAQLRKAKRVPLQKERAALVLGSWTIRRSEVYSVHRRTFTSPVSFSFKTRHRSVSLGPARKRRCNGRSSSESLRMKTGRKQTKTSELKVFCCFPTVWRILP